MKYIIANWKMNKKPDETLEYIQVLNAKLEERKKEKSDILDCKKIIICVPYIDIFYANLMSQDTEILIGAQNCFYEESGAYTGEISAEMLKSLGIKYIIVGHSERRKIFKEKDEDISKKVAKVLGLGLKPILCIGESEEEYKSKKTLDVLKRQIKEGLENSLQQGLDLSRDDNSV